MNISELKKLAYQAFDEGRLHDASSLFAAVMEQAPEDSDYAYMKGLANKYARQWQASLDANLRAIEVDTERNEGAIWNAAIAATALGLWDQARALWQSVGIPVPKDNGPIDYPCGTCCVRLNPWGSGEVVYAKRIDPVRSKLENVPLPKSGFRFGDLILNDGAQTGQRNHGNGTVPVFNAMQLLEQSPFETFVVFVEVGSESELKALLEIKSPGLGLIEDWTETVRYLCLRCSYGAPHRNKMQDNHVEMHETTETNKHQEEIPDSKTEDSTNWNSERNLGIAAQSRVVIDQVLKRWQQGSEGRQVDAIENPKYPLSAPDDGLVWWRGMDEEES